MYVSLMERKGVQKGKIVMAPKILVAGESNDKILAYAEITSEQLEKSAEKSTLRHTDCLSKERHTAGAPQGERLLLPNLCLTV